jgi:hypothetical protein
MVEQNQGLQSIVSDAVAGPNFTQSDNQTTKQPDFSKGYGGIHNFFTTASILTSKGIFELKKVEIDERSPINILPLSIAIDLRLTLYSDNLSAFTISGRPVQTSQYSRFTIQVAGHNTTILAGVASNIDMILLGRDWIYRVNLLNGVANQNYYISIPLTTTAALRSDIKIDDIRPRRIVRSDKAIKKYDNFYLSDRSLSLDEQTLSEDSLSQECSEDEDYNNSEEEYEDDDEEEEKCKNDDGFIDDEDIEEFDI